MTNDDNLKVAEEFEAAALPHMNDLYRAASAILGNRTEAEDIVQEAYFQAWKSFHRFELGTNCRAWLFKILFHVIHHHRRKWYRFKFISDAEDMLANTLVYEPPVRQDLSDEDVLAAFKKLPEQYAEVVLLADVEELSYKEVHEALNIPLGTVMSRLSRGRNLLRKHLTELAEDYRLQPASKSLRAAKA